MINDYIQAFLKETPYKKLDTVNGSKGLCDGISKDFRNFLGNNGLKAEIIEGIGFKPELSPSAHADWQAFKGKDQKFLAHVVVKYQDMVIDFTGAQFNEQNGKRILYTYSDFQSEWQKIKTLRI